MQSNRAQAVSWVHNKAEQGRDRPWSQTINPQPINREMVERGAQALFEHVFSGTERLDGKHLWVNCDDVTKEAFRAEAESVLEATVPLMGNDT
jgi:hypothetical protein